MKDHEVDSMASSKAANLQSCSVCEARATVIIRPVKFSMKVGVTPNSSLPDDLNNFVKITTEFSLLWRYDLKSRIFSNKVHFI
jgi:hypothetical protein